MNERDFVSQKRAVWDQLAALLEKANGRQGVRALGRDELLSLGSLYRRVSSDLAYARAHAISDDLILHLNGLVGRTHALLYEAETSGNAARSVIDFYLTDFPRTLQKYIGYFLATIAVTIFGALVAYELVIHQPDRLNLFVPEQFRSSVDVWKSGKIDAEPSAEFSSMLMTHNLTVGLIAFGGGLFVSAPTTAMLFENGTILGALAALMTQVHHHNTFWPGILPHGIAELTAIFICGSAGFLLGMALLLPGPRSRLDALWLSARDAIKLVLGTIPLFIFAGIVEGMFSHLAIPATARYAFAAVNGILWYLYLFLPRPTPEPNFLSPASGKERK